MKKLRLLLAAMLASMCALQSAEARTAPTFPTTAKTLQSGNTYYLYNPGSDQFLYLNGSYVYAGASSYSAVTITNVENDVYNLKFEDSNYYLYCSGDNLSTTSSATSSYIRFHINKTDGGYHIQRDYSYNATYYLGNNSGNSYIYSNFTSGNIVWQLYDQTGVNAILRYRAKKALYDALVSADNYSLSFAVQEYETLYANSSATNEQLRAAAKAINQGLMYHDALTNGASEYPIYTEATGDAVWNQGSINYTSIQNGEGVLKAVLEVDQDATLIYNYVLFKTWYDFSFDVYLDGVLYQNINNYEGYCNGGFYSDVNGFHISSYQRYFVELTAGRHTIEWKAKSAHQSYYTLFWLKGIAAYKTPTITVNLTQAGSLGTEVLYNVDHVKDVRKLVVKGNMNADDWTRVNMMTGLFELDLTETTVESLPRVNPGSFFHKLALPKNLKAIEKNALQDLRLDAITFPSTLTSLGEYALSGTRIKEAILPASVTSVGTYAFANNESLLKVVWPTQVTTIPDYCFYEDYEISTFNLPEGLTSIGNSALYKNYKCKYQLPSTIKSIGGYAFFDDDAIESLNIPRDVTIGELAFVSCTKLKNVKIGEGDVFNGSRIFESCTTLEEIEFPTTFYNIGSYEGYMLNGCTALKKVTFKSPTLIGGSYYKSFFSNTSGKSIQVYVPSYLVNAYKLDPYWYNYNIMGFSTADITDWIIRKPLTFYSQDRFEGTPNVTLRTGGAWTINGTLAQNVNDLHTNYSSQSSSGDLSAAAKIISNCNNVSINGKYWHSYYAYPRSSYGRWYFICLPFDIKVSEITCGNNALFAIRYYDGANRAANGTGGNWKDYAADATIKAGTGFIIQVNKECWIDFYALNNTSKQNVVSNKIFTKTLDANTSTQASNKGWNLVGNPWLSYYNIHKLNFTAPITVYDGYNRTYKAYSVIDDDYAIRPNEAFFVQCPDAVSSISFPVDGRQLTSTIESQNGVKADVPQTQTRWLVDVELSNGELTDKTRFVLNAEAAFGYEMNRDASKFFENSTTCPQLYTLEESEPLAINERPMGDGTVQLGMTLTADGTYTLSAPRNQFQKLLLYDYETGAETNLTADSYTFTAKAGTDESRFELRMNSSSIVTAIEGVQANAKPQSDVRVYNLNGQRVSQPQRGVYVVNGKKVVVNSSK